MKLSLSILFLLVLATIDPQGAMHWGLITLLVVPVVPSVLYGLSHLPAPKPVQLELPL